MGLVEQPYASLFSRLWFVDSEGSTGVVKRVERVVGTVDEGAEGGVYLCYGDLRRRRFVEHIDVSVMVGLGNAVSESAERSIGWVHMPVMKNKTDRGFFEPWGEIETGKETELCPGLVHDGDLKGTRKRIAVT